LPFGYWLGALAQLGEHLLCKQGVIGSIPIGSTIIATWVALSIRQKMRKTVCWLTIRLARQAELRLCERIFDIVNGFLIDAVAHRDHSVGSDPCVRTRMRNKQMLNLAEIIVRTYYSTSSMQA
jgi:hypothetical protein